MDVIVAEVCMFKLARRQIKAFKSTAVTPEELLSMTIAWRQNNSNISGTKERILCEKNDCIMLQEKNWDGYQNLLRK